MVALKSFAPTHLVEDAQESGFFQCPTCGMVWFGRNDIRRCPEGHGHPVHVAVLCRTCDIALTVDQIAAHLNSKDHLNSIM